MANTLSAKKNIRKSQKRRRQNRTVLTSLKKQIKEFLGNPSTEKLKTLQRSLDKASRKSLIKKNKARRLNSRLSKRFPPPK